MRGLSLGLVGLVQSVALAVGPPFGIWLLGKSASLLFISAAGAAAVSVALSFQLKSTPLPVRRARFFKFRRGWLSLLALTFLTVVYWGVVVAYLPIQVPTSMISGVGWFFTAAAIGVLVGRVPIGLLSDRVAPSSLLRIGGMRHHSSILILVVPASLASLVLAGLGTGLGSGLLVAPTLIELQNRSDEADRGTSMALWSTSFASGVGVGTIGRSARGAFRIRPHVGGYCRFVLGRAADCHGFATDDESRAIADGARLRGRLISGVIPPSFERGYGQAQAAPPIEFRLPAATGALSSGGHVRHCRN